MRLEIKKHYPILLACLLGFFILFLLLSGKDYSRYAPSLRNDPVINAHPIDGSSSHWLFTWKDESNYAESVLLLGNFVSRGEAQTRIPMINTKDGAWRGVVHLDPGQYAYKFLINNTLLVPPAESEILERTMDGAGQVFVPNPDAPYLINVVPADESTIQVFTNISFKFSGRLSSLNTGDIRLALNNRPVPLRFDRSTAAAQASIADDAPEGQYFLQVSGQNNSGKSIVEYQSVFFYHKEDVTEIPDTKLEDALAYRVLLNSYKHSDGMQSALSQLISKLDYLNDGKTPQAQNAGAGAGPALNPADPWIAREGTAGNGAHDVGASLGVQILVLYGVLPAKDVWGREITSFENIRADYGTRALLTQLAAECRRRGIRLLLQLNLAYISNSHEFFQKSYGNPGSKHWDWFFFQNDIGTSYLGFADDPSLPRINTSSESAQNYLLDIVRNWASTGIDGFLFEHADLLPSVWWEKVRGAVIAGSGRSDTIIAASCYGNSSYVNQLFQNKFNAVETLNHATDLALAFGGNRPEMISANSPAWERAIPQGAAWFKPSANHGMLRLASLFQKQNRIQAALGYLLTSGGIPMLQWGDELEIHSPEPPLEREPSPMLWEKAEDAQNDPESTWNLIRKLALLRKQYPELRRDTHNERIVLHWARKAETGIALWVRQITPERFFVGVMLLESDAKEIEAEFTLPMPDTEDARYRGRDILHTSGVSVVARCTGDRVRPLTLPIAPERGFQLWLFERLSESE